VLTVGDDHLPSRLESNPNFRNSLCTRSNPGIAVMSNIPPPTDTGDPTPGSIRAAVAEKLSIELFFL
jgi:hypothetical protein